MLFELLYFTSPSCTVCHSLRPKLEQMVHDKFPDIRFIPVDIAQQPELSAKYMVFAAPTMILLFEESVVYKRSGLFSLIEVETLFNRIIELNT